MIPEVKELWTSGLRSGRFQKGLHRLSTKHEGYTLYCCLGVLCELAIEAGVYVKVSVDTFGERFYDGEYMVLPLSVQRWAGLEDKNPIALRDWVDQDEIPHNFTLAELNDGSPPYGFPRHTFAQIANIIEENF